jgi:hypothetical protein
MNDFPLAPTIARTGKILEGMAKITKSKPLFTSALAHHIVDRYMFTDLTEAIDQITTH